MKSLWILVSIVASVGTIGAQPVISVSVQKQLTAQKQIAFAKKLIALVPATLGRPYDRHVAVANAAANLQAVERGWPNDSTAIAEANALLSRVPRKGYELPEI